MTDITPPPLPGDVVGEYRLEQLLGVGGMATVYRASSETQGWVAIKVLHPGKANTEEARRFRREFLTLRGLLHPNIVQVYESGHYGDYPWIAMEIVEGTDLGTQIEAWNTQTPPDRFARVSRIFRQVCEALGYCHDKGLIHRDLKPSNVLVTRQGDAKLTDFGVVKAPGGVFTTQLTVAGKLVGTVAFMAPEQITGDTVDARADLYSLGAVLYVMLTGTRPIQADSIAGYLARHLTEKPRPPSELDPRVPPRMERICLKLLAKEPSQRFSSVAEILGEMDRDDSELRRSLHGRDHQIALLLARLETLADGAGGVMIISGREGVGKSALLVELEERSAATGCTVVRIQGMDPRPFAALREKLSETGASVSLEKRLSIALSEGPWTLLIDDLEALPLDDLERLTRWVRNLIAIQGEPLMVVVCTRELHGLVGPFCSGSATGLSPEALTIEGLEKRPSISLIRDLGVTGAAGAILGNRLHDELKGNPGLLIEQVDALLDAGWLNRSPDGSLKSTRSMEELREASLPLPESVQVREAQRLSDLSVEARRVYDTLAVLGMEIGPGLLAEVAGLPMSDCTRALNDLESKRLVRQWIDGVQEVVAMLGSRQRDVVYALMDTDSRATLHRRAAVALKRRFRRRLGAMSEVIARHLTLGGAIAEAYPLLLNSAQRRFRGGRTSEARQLMIQAKNLRSTAEEQIDEVQAQKLRWQLFVLEGQLLEHSGDLTGAAQAWEHALTAAESDGDFNAVAQSRAGLGLVYAARGEAGLAVDGLTQALAQLPQGDPLWPRVAQALATARLEMGDGNGAEDLWTQLETLGRATQTGSVLAEAILGRGMVAMISGELDSGRGSLEDAELQLRDLVRPLKLSKVLLALAELGLAQGRLLECVERSLEAERVAREIPRVVHCIHALGVAAQARAALGRGADALSLAREAATLARARGRVNTVPELLAAASVARALCATGEPGEGLVLLPPPAGRNIAGIQDPVRVVWSVRARALSLSKPDEAIEAAKEAMARVPSRLPWIAVREQLDLAIALVQAGSSSAGREAERSVRMASKCGLSMCELEALELQRRVEPDGALGGRTEVLRSQLASSMGEPESFIRRWT